MPLQIRRPIEIELDPEPREREDRKQRTRLAEEMKKNFRRMVEERSERNRQLLREQRLRERGQEAIARERARQAAIEAQEARRPTGPRPEPRGPSLLERARGVAEAAVEEGIPAAAAGTRGLLAASPTEILGGAAAQAAVTGAAAPVVFPAAVAAGAAREAGVPVPDVPGFATLRRAGERAGAVVDPFAAEQKFIASRTQPIIQDALIAVGVPESVAVPVATVGSQIALPTSVIPFVGAGSRAVRVARALTVGAALSVEQERAFIQEFEQRDPELWELLLAAGAGGGGAGVIETGVIGTLRRLRPGAVAGEVAEEVAPAAAREAVPEALPGRFAVPTEEITPETVIPPGVSRVSPIQGQQLAELPAGQLELPLPKTRSAQEIAGLAAERRINSAAVREGALTGANTPDDVLRAEAGVAAARQADNVARAADVEDLTKTSFDDLIAEARRVCRG